MTSPDLQFAYTARIDERIAVLTLDGSQYGQHLLRALSRHVGRPALVIVCDNSLRRRWRLLRSVAGRIGWRDAILYALEETASPTKPSTMSRDPWPGYGAFAEAVVQVSSVNAPSVAEHLRQHKIEILVLGQSGIVPESVLAAPRTGTINAHPGWLPDYRGIDCAAWTILDGRFDLVGSSLHWVDRGIDTGGIIRRRAYRWRGDESLRTLEARLYDDCVELLVEAVADIRRGTLPSEANVGGVLLRKMPRADRARVRVSLARHTASLGATVAGVLRSTPDAASGTASRRA